MIKEYRYFLAISILGIGGLVGLGGLTHKYAPDISGHWLVACRMGITELALSGNHIVGAVVVILFGLALLAGIGRVVFSLVKTSQQISYLLKFKREIPGKLLALAKRHQFEESQLVVISNQGHHVFSFGLGRPKILISTGLINLLSTKELEAVFLHEIYHARYGHGRLLFGGDVLAKMVFFLPIVKVLVEKLRGFCERQADAFTMSIQSDSKHIRLALAKVISDDKHFMFTGFAAVEVRERLSRLMGRASARKEWPMGSVFISGVMLALGLSLWLMPMENHTLAMEGDSIEKCGENQCSIYCLRDI